MCTAWRGWSVAKYVLLASTPFIFWLSAILILSTPTPFLVVASGSMRPGYGPGDLVVVKGVPWERIEAGDIVAFRSPRPEDKRIYVHRAIEIVQKEGQHYLRTKGDGSPHADSWLVPKSNVLGRVITSFAGLGKIRVFAGKYFPHLVIAVVAVNLAYFLLSHKRRHKEVSSA